MSVSVRCFNEYHEIQTYWEVIQQAYYLLQPTSKEDGGSKSFLER